MSKLYCVFGNHYCYSLETFYEFVVTLYICTARSGRVLSAHLKFSCVTLTKLFRSRNNLGK